MEKLIAVVPIIVSIVGIVGTISALIVNIYTIRKLKQDIQNQKRPDKIEEIRIVRPTLREILDFGGDAKEYAKWWDEQQKEKKERFFGFIPFLPLFFISFDKLVDFPMRDDLILSGRILKRLKVCSTTLIVFSFAMCIFLSLLFFQLHIIPEWTLWPLSDVKVPSVVSALLIGYYLTFLIVLLLGGILLRE